MNYYSVQNVSVIGDREEWVDSSSLSHSDYNCAYGEIKENLKNFHQATKWRIVFHQKHIQLDAKGVVVYENHKKNYFYLD